jgi:PTH1 family peptidyl-tRNA hydrolase
MVVVGLGNPGPRYEKTRHNAGAMAVEVLLGRHRARAASDRRMRCRWASLELGGLGVVVAIPETYMNDSGLAVEAIVETVGLDSWEQLVIVHDDLDLDVGVVRLKRGGGSGGHRGLISIGDCLGSLDFTRVRIGIGRSSRGCDVVEWVLSVPGEDELLALEAACSRAADAVEQIASRGIASVMSEFNARSAPGGPR